MGEIICGDCIEEMKEMEENSVDSIVTDPPYAFEGGFMDKEWDNFAEPKQYQKWCEKWAEQCLRVLKPGGYILAFSGTHSFHRLAVGLEDAGFNIKTTIMWMYGCLSEDTEILTLNGWKSKDEITTDDIVFSIDYESDKSKKGRVKTSPVNHIFEYQIDDELVHFKNDNTDQLLTKNHKVLAKTKNRVQIDGKRVKYDVVDDFRYIDAGQIRKSSRITLPLGSVYDGDESIWCKSFAELIGLVLTEGWFQSDAVNISQTNSNQDVVKRINYILGSLDANYSKYVRNREYEGKEYKEYQWYITGEVAERLQKIIPNNRPTKKLWHLPFEEKEGLFKGLMEGDGSKGRNGKFTSFYQDDMEFLEWFQVLCHLMGKQGRIDEDKMCVQVHHNPTTEIQGKHRKNDRKKYQGKVWCINTDYGNFFARRNGKIFITGNSGFPKSHDISKAIDSHFNKEDEREKIGVKTTPDGKKFPSQQHDDNNVATKWKRSSGKKTAPATPEAEQWDGWGTALKPAFEPIVLAQKPREGTYAQNVLEYSVGGLNIDGCRIEAKDGGWEWGTQTDIKSGGYGSKRPSDGDVYDKDIKGGEDGRWPPNVILDPKASELLDRQSGHLESGDAGKEEVQSDSDWFGGGKLNDNNQIGDEGGASRFFYSSKAHKSERNAGLGDKKNDISTLKPINLMRYLVRLVTPPNGTVLDPFGGSGTTGIACVVEGFDYFLIEKREKFAKEIAPKRMDYWSKEQNQKELKDHRELPDADGWMGTEEVPVDLLPEVKGIGEKTMESVKKHAQQISLNELKEVDGIGEKTVERICERFCEEGEEDEDKVEKDFRSLVEI